MTSLYLKTAECNELHSLWNSQKEHFKRNLKVVNLQKFCLLKSSSMTFNKSIVIYRRSCFLPKRKQKHINCQKEIHKNWTRMNSWNKLIQMILLKWQNMILIFLMRDFFFFFFFCGKVRYGSSSGQERKYLLEKFVCMPRIHFSKRATAVNKKKTTGKEQMFLKPFWNGK